MNRLEFIKRIESIDWIYFEKELPAISFLLRCTVDYYYIEQIAQGKINVENDARMKAASQIIKQGVEFIPLVGDILSMIAEIGGIDLGAFTSISDSGLARKRLNEWIVYIYNNYSKNRYDIQDLHNLNKTFMEATKRLIYARPKCMSPTGNCSKEHQYYITRTSLLKESQQAIYDIYYNYCVNDYIFARWVQGVKTYNTTNFNLNDVKNSTSKAGLIALVGLGLLFAKKF